jgi:hypothetical protein
MKTSCPKSSTRARVFSYCCKNFAPKLNTFSLKGAQEHLIWPAAYENHIFIAVLQFANSQFLGQLVEILLALSPHLAQLCPLWCAGYFYIT